MKFPIALALLLAAPLTANACRELPADLQFEVSDIVVVGWVSSIRIPNLESLPASSSDFDAFNRITAGERELEIVVTQTRKGTSDRILSLELDRCNGAFTHIGSRVTAYHTRDGTWRVSPLPLVPGSEP
jgi:hypothetical protein